MSQSNVKNKIRKPRFSRIESVDSLNKLLETNPNVAIHYFYANNEKSPLRDPVIRAMLDAKGVTCAEIDVSLRPEIPSKMGVRAYPVTLFYKNGKMVITQAGTLHTTGWSRWVDKAFSA